MAIATSRSSGRRRSKARRAGQEDGSFRRYSTPPPVHRIALHPRSLLHSGPFLPQAPNPPTPTPSPFSFLEHADAVISSTEVKTEEDLLPPGAEPGTVPTDLDQSTGLERFEILGKMQGVDVFDMKPLDASRKGTDLASTTVKAFYH